MIPCNCDRGHLHVSEHAWYDYLMFPILVIWKPVRCNCGRRFYFRRWKRLITEDLFAEPTRAGRPAELANLPPDRAISR